MFAGPACGFGQPPLAKNSHFLDIVDPNNALKHCRVLTGWLCVNLLLLASAPF